MFTTKSRIAVLLVLMILLLAVGNLLMPCGVHGDAAPAPATPKVPKEMLEKRLEAAKKVWAEKWKRMIVGIRRAQPSDLFGWSERLLEAELALLEKKDDRVKSLKAHVDRTRDVERFAVTFAKRGIGSDSDGHAATYERINAEIRYFQFTGELAPPPPEVKNDLPTPEEGQLPPPPEKEHKP